MVLDMRTDDRLAIKRGPGGLTPSHPYYTLALSRKHLPVRSDVARAGMSKRGHIHTEGRLPSHTPERALRPTAVVAGEGPAGNEKTIDFRDLVADSCGIGGSARHWVGECRLGTRHG